MRFFLLLFALLINYFSNAQVNTSARSLRNLQIRSIDPLNIREIDSLQMYTDYTVSGKMWLPSLTANRISDKKANFSNRTVNKKRVIQPVPFNQSNRLNGTASTVCYVTSGRNFLNQDSIFLYTHDPTLTLDGNVLVTGQLADYSKSPVQSGGFCMKTDLQGNVIWAKLYDSAVRAKNDYINYFKSIEMRDGSLLLAGRTSNRVSGNDDFMLTKLDKNGNIIWSKTYTSRYWQGFNGSGDFFNLRGLEEDQATGEIYFVNNHWFGKTTITKVDPSDGHIIWSNSYQSWDSDYPFGIVINPTNIFLFQLETGYYNESYVTATVINKSNGDTISKKHYHRTGDSFAPGLYNTYGMTKLNTGHFLLTGPTTGFYEYPKYTGTKDLYHAGIIELDENLNYVKAYGFKNRIESNGGNTKVSLYANGSGVFTMFKYISGYTGESEICLFNNEQIYHQRKRLHFNEGLPYEPSTLQLPDGGFLNIKLIGDSTKLGTDGSRIDYYRIHTSDTASLCLGVKDTATSLWYFNYALILRLSDSIHKNVFKESRVKTLTSWNFTAIPGPACQVISICDTLKIESSATSICPGSSVTITIHKNKECGSLVPLLYDTTWVSNVKRLSDSTYSFSFSLPGNGFIRASLMGCTLKQDSLLLQVMPARNSIDLGPDTVICPGNTILLNAKKGFATYQWQDGSTDSTFSVTQSGIYFVKATNACGGIFFDTVIVSPHPPIPFDVGPDLSICNRDSLTITAPSGFINYAWTPAYNISSTTSQTVKFYPSVDTVYKIRAEKTPGCFAYDSVKIKVYSSPKIDLGPDKSFCFGDSVILNAGNGFNKYLWSTGSASQQIIVKKAGTFSVSASTINNCISKDTLIVINVYPNPIVTLDHDSTLCTGTARVLNAGNFSSYLWNTGNTSQTISVNNVGVYSVTVTDNNNCKGGDTTKIVTILPSPFNFLPVDTAVCSYGSLQLSSKILFLKYLWNTNAVTSSITISQPGIYWLQVKDINNCSGRDSIIVAQKNCLQGFYIPNAFSPNNDGKNDLFRPMLFGKILLYEFAIYNHWGEVVFKSVDVNKGWDGKYKSFAQDNRVFVWTCKYQFENENVKTEKGTVLILR